MLKKIIFMGLINIVVFVGDMSCVKANEIEKIRTAVMERSCKGKYY